MRIQDFIVYEEQSVAASANTNKIDMEHQLGLSVQADWQSTTSSAVLTLQASNDGVSWVDLASTINIASNNGTAMLYATDYHYKYARVKIEINSGTVDSLKLRVMAKGI